MGWFIAQSLVFILVAFAIGLLVGWLIWGRRRDKDKTVVEEVSSVAQPEPEAADADAETDADSESSISAEAEAEPEVTVVPVPRAGSEEAAAAESDVEPEAEAETASDVAVAETSPEPEAEPEPEVAGAAVVAEAESVAREAAEPEPEPQDLRRIEGIGPKIDAALKAQGYLTYASVAAATEDELRAAIKAEGVRFAPAASSWAQQAQLLADGDEDGLKEFQDYLVGGQDRSVKFHEKVDFADVDEITDAEEKAEAIAEDAAEVAAVEAAEGNAAEAKA